MPFSTNPDKTHPLVAVVGPCASGKSTLIHELVKYGVNARHVAQEHSYVADMWQRLTKPDILVFLDASFQVAQKRRNLSWTEADYMQQQYRLRHAREHANLYLFTDNMEPKVVVQRVIEFLASI